jgi:hypothetical protein
VLPPSFATIVNPAPVRAWYQPGIVELLTHVGDPLAGSESKFSVSGEPSAVMLPSLVRADDRGAIIMTPMLRSIAATVINSVVGLKRIAEWKDKDIDEPLVAIICALSFYGYD